MTKETSSTIKTLFALVLLLAGSRPASALLDNGVDPSHLGKGDWIWEMAETEANLGVSSVQAVINFEKAEGMQFLIVKCADGGQYGPDYWPQFDSDLVTRCHAAGIKIFGFGYVYGSYYGSGQVQAEIDAAVACMGVTDSSGVPMDGFLIDAEIEYNGQSADAITYCEGIRAVYPTRCLAHSPYPIPSYNESFPYIEFGRYCDVVMPQDYWYDQFESSGGVTPQYMADLMNSDWIKWQNTWVAEGDGSSVKPLCPIGQGFQGDSPVAIPGSQLTSFYNELKSENPCATAGGYQGITFWVAQSHTTDMWNAIAAMTFATPPVITNQPVSITNCQSATASFSVLAGPASSTYPLAFQWRKNSGNVSGATASALTLSTITTNDAASYNVVVNNSAGSITSAVATLTVALPPAIVTQPQPQAVCQGGSATFTVAVSGTSLTYQWQFNGTNINGSLSSYTLSNIHTNKAGNYTVIVSNSCNVITSAVAALTVPLPPAIATQPQSQVITQSGNAAFTVTAATGTAPSYQWQFNGANVNGTLSSYSLSNVHANKAGAYTVVLTNPCSTLTSSVAWLTVVTPLASQTITQGGSAIFTVTNYGGDSSLACQWQKNGINLTDGGPVSGSGTTNLTLSSVSTNDAASYSVVCVNGAGSAATVGATLTVLVPPYIITPPQSQTVTQGGGATFTVAAAGTTPLSFQWQKNGVNISGATMTTLPLSATTTNDAGSYTVLVSNGVGSPASASASLTVLVPPYIIAQPQSQTVTQGGNAIFTVAAAGTAPLSFQWQKNGINLTDGGPVSGSGTANLTLSSVSTNDAASYAVVVSNGAGSAATIGATLTVLVTTTPLQFNSICLLPDGSVELSISGTPGLSYDLECTSNWVDWTTLTTLVAGTNGLFQYNDPSVTNAGQRLYRLTLEP